MPKPGPRTTYKYSEEFEATAVRLNKLPGVEAQDVAESLYIHPFMLSRWRKQVREDVIVAKGSDVDKEVAAELKALHKLKLEPGASSHIQPAIRGCQRRRNHYDICLYRPSHVGND